MRKLYISIVYKPAAASGNRQEYYRRYREDLVHQAGVCVYVGGVKLNESSPVTANGVATEYEMLRKMGRPPFQSERHAERLPRYGKPSTPTSKQCLAGCHAARLTLSMIRMRHRKDLFQRWEISWIGSRTREVPYSRLGCALTVGMPGRYLVQLDPFRRLCSDPFRRLCS